MKATAFLASAAWTMLTVVAVCAQEDTSFPPDTKDLAYARAAQAASPVAVDGDLSENAWRSAQALGTLADRMMARPPAYKTAFRLCYDAAHWYVAAQCEQPGADQTPVISADRDSAAYSEDSVEIFLQPPGQKDHYHVAVNLGGTVFDERNSDGASSWDSDARVITRRSAEGWTIEAALPVAPMKAGPLAAGQIWRIGLYRNLMQAGQMVAWSSVEGGGWHAAERFGIVELVEASETPLPAVNLALGQPLALGENAATIQLNGAINPSQYTLDLAIVPVRSRVLPEDQQDLAHMDPSVVSIPWPEPLGASVEIRYRLERIGAAHVAATLQEKARPGDVATARLVSRAVADVTLRREDTQPLEFTLQQPFVTVEAEILFDVSLNLEASRLPGAQLSVSLVDSDGKAFLTIEPRAADKRSQGLLPVKSLPLGVYRATAVLKDAAGATVASAERPLTKREPFGVPKRVEFGKDGVCLIDGKPTLPLGFMLAPPNADVRNAGYDHVLYGGETLEGRGGLDVAAETGVFAILHICNYLRGKNDFDAIRAVVSLRKTEPNLLAWYIADEPEAYGDTPDVLRKAYTIIKQIDPNHPVLVLTNAPGMLAFYKGCADVIMADPYPIPGHPLKLVAEWTDAAVHAAAANGQAVWMTPQGFGWADLGTSKDASPTCEELNAMLYTCLIHGAKGITWWPYSILRQNYWPHFVRMGRECRFFEPWVLHGLDARGLPAGVQEAGDVHWRAWEHDGNTLILAVNLTPQSRRLDLPLPPGARVSFPFDKETQDLVASSAGSSVPPCIKDNALTLSFAPVQAMAIVLERKVQ